jgi:hypothetical protein
MKLVHQLSIVNASKLEQEEEEEHQSTHLVFFFKQTKINLLQLHVHHISLPYFNDVPSLPFLFIQFIFFFFFILFINNFVQ